MAVVAIMQPQNKMQEAVAPHERSFTLSGKVDKILPIGSGGCGVAQITIPIAEELYRDIRVPSVFRDQQGNSVALEIGAEVEITIRIRSQQNKPSESERSDPPLRVASGD